MHVCVLFCLLSQLDNFYHLPSNYYLIVFCTFSLFGQTSNDIYNPSDTGFKYVYLQGWKLTSPRWSDMLKFFIQCCFYNVCILIYIVKEIIQWEIKKNYYPFYRKMMWTKHVDCVWENVFVHEDFLSTVKKRSYWK